MSRPSMSSTTRNSDDSSWGRRRSFLALAAIGRSHPDKKDPPKLRKKPKHGRASSLFTELYQSDRPTSGRSSPDNDLRPDDAVPRRRRPPLAIHGSGGSGTGGKRPSSVFDNFRIPGRASHDEVDADHSVAGPGEPLSAVSTTAPSLFGDAGMEGTAPAPRTVLLQGEVQTSAGMFRKKKEYLVLTESHILRYKSQVKASEAWRAVPSPMVARPPPPAMKHGSMTSVSSQTDFQTVSESSGDKDGKVSLRQVVAVQRADEGRPYFSIEMAYLDEESGHSSGLTLQFLNPDERDVWLGKIRLAAIDARARQLRSISNFNVEHAARIVERDNDYDPQSCAIYKIVQRQSASKTGRASSDDITKVASNVCLLAVGVHKVHIIQLAKAPGRASPSLANATSQASFGILNLTSIRASPHDDSLELTFRQPLQKPRQLFLASSAAYEIAARLHNAESLLRPQTGQRLYKLHVPRDVDHLLSATHASEEEHGGLDRTLAAYCISYGLSPSNIRYTIDYNCEDAPRFDLLPPADQRSPEYGPLALLAVMRALRYNESFGSISFASISLDSLNGLHDGFGREYICSRTKRGTPIRLSPEELGQACLLVQEVRALAATSKRLRRMDFSNCIADKAGAPSLELVDEEQSRMPDLGCGIVEALVPLCRQQTTNVDWICLNGIQLSETDMDYLVGAAVDKSCHFRAIELNRCGLSDRSMGLILDALRAQDNTIEAIEIGGNTARLNPAAFDSQLSIFGFVRKLNLSNAPHTSGNEPLLTAETLLIWRLQELRFSGTALNSASIDAMATYLAHPQSTTLHELYFDNAYLSGADVATLLLSMSHATGQPRDLHLDISQNPITRDLEQVTQAIAAGFAPSHLTMRAIEYREESLFRKVLGALATNKTIRYLDLSQTALPGDASEETCKMLYKLLAENDTLIELDLSGEDSRLASSKFGSGLNDALIGLQHNRTLQSFRIEKQKLGLQGASTLAEVLKENRTLRELHCDNNEIPLHGLTDLVNALIENTALVYLPSMDDGRRAAFKAAEVTMKAMSDHNDSGLGGHHHHGHHPSRSTNFGSGVSGMRRSLASVRRSAARTASAYTPSFPALPTSSTRSNIPASKQRASGSFAPFLSASSNSSDTKTSKSGLHPFKFTHASPSTSSLGSQIPLIPSTAISSAHPNSQSHPSFSHTSSIAVTAPIMSFSLQDIQTTHRLLSEQWDRQVYRLAQYLDRNWCLLHAIPVKMEVEDEKFERPSSVGSLGKLLGGTAGTAGDGGPTGWGRLASANHTPTSARSPRLERGGYFDGRRPSAGGGEKSQGGLEVEESAEGRQTKNERPTTVLLVGEEAERLVRPLASAPSTTAVPSVASAKIVSRSSKVPLVHQTFLLGSGRSLSSSDEEDDDGCKESRREAGEDGDQGQSGTGLEDGEEDGTEREMAKVELPDRSVHPATTVLSGKLLPCDRGLTLNSSERGVTPAEVIG